MSGANSNCVYHLQWFPSAGPLPAVFWQEINTGGKSVLIICTFTITINNQSQDLDLYL